MARNGTGVRKATESSIEVEFTYRGERCRERIKCKPTPANIRKIELFRENFIESIENGTFDYSATFPESKRAAKLRTKDTLLSVEKLLDKWLDSKERHIKSSTYNGYRKVIAILKPVFGGKSPEELKKLHVREWCDKLTCGNKRIRNLTEPLVAAIQLAVDDELLAINPLSGFKYKRIEPPKIDHVDPLSREESEKLLSVLAGQYKNMVQFALWTGVRSSELIAVRWGDIDFIRGVVMISRAKTQDAKQDEATKTRAGTREVKLLAPALAALGSQKAFTFIMGEHVFLNELTGKPYTGDQQLWKAWKRSLLKAGIRYRNPYQTRHTYASRMLSAGENLAWISKQMGHDNVSVTTKHYARFMADSQPDAGSKAVELFSGAK